MSVSLCCACLMPILSVIPDLHSRSNVHTDLCFEVMHSTGTHTQEPSTPAAGNLLEGVVLH